MVNHVNKTAKKNISCIPVAPHFRPSPMSPEDILQSTGRSLDDNGAAVVIFTSGTTGPPKGAVMRRLFLHDWSAAMADHFGITEKDVILHVLPVHHATGVGINFLPYIFSGACIEFCSGSVDIPFLWERWRRGGLDVFSGVPTIYMRMMRHFEQKLASLPEPEKNQYIAGARGLRALLCGTSALPSPVQNFWTDILGGKRIVTRYGATEIGAVFNMPIGGGDVPDGSVGPVFPGATVKLSGGEEGEILVKSPYMFSKYVLSLSPPKINAKSAFSQKLTIRLFHQTKILVRRNRHRQRTQRRRVLQNRRPRPTRGQKPLHPRPRLHRHFKIRRLQDLRSRH